METKIEQINVKKEKRESIFPLILAVIIFCFLIFLIFLCFEKIKQDSQDIFFAKSAIALLKIREKEIEKFIIEYQNYLPNFQRIDQEIVDLKAPLGFIEFIEDAAVSAGVDLVISPLTFPKESQSKIASVQVLAKGDFLDILAFLEKLESGSYLISMNNLSFEYISASKAKIDSAVDITQVKILMDILSK